MRSKITLTVFIPCYGKCPYLSKTLDSIFDQDFECDVVLCPQGDTDVSMYLNKYPNIKIVKLEKPSLYKARIFLFDKSKSDYIYYIDDDDILPKGLFKYINDIIIKTNFLDLYRIPLKEFYSEIECDKYRDQKFNFDYFFESKENFIKKCFNRTYHNGVVHLFIKNTLEPQWFDVDVFQTEDRLITYAIADSVKTKICIINDAFYLYRKYSSSHSRTLDFLKGRDDFIVVNNCLKKYMSLSDLIINSYPIILRLASYLKYLFETKQFNYINFFNIYSNEDIWFYLNFFMENKKTYKKSVGNFNFLLTKYIFKKRFKIIKFLIFIKCKYEILKYKQIQY